MLYVPFLLLLGAAALCFGLSSRIATRQIGMLAAGASAVAGLALVVLARLQPLPLESHVFRWVVPDSLILDFLLRLDLPAFGLSLLVLFGGALALLLVSLALAPGLRGFGALFGCALVVLATSVLALLCVSPLAWPIIWAALGLASFATAWSSGTLREGVDSSFNLLYSLPASLLLLIGLLLSGDPANGAIQGIGAACCVVLATALAAGLPPFRSSLDNLLSGPAALSGLLTGLGLPLVALATLWRLIETSPDLQQSLLWRYGLAAYGVLSLAVCAAGALRERTLKAIIGWLIGAQGSIILVALALLGLDETSNSPTLLISNFALSTLACATTVAVLERFGRGDDYTRIEHEAQPLDRNSARLLALSWGLASASALGLPPLWGFWGYRKLLEGAMTSSPWVVPPLLFGLTLLAFALLLPLGGFLSTALKRQTSEAAPANRTTLVALIPTAYLLLVGLVPSLGWPLVAIPRPLAQAVAWGAFALTIGGLLLVRRMRAPTPRSDTDAPSAILAADSLAESMEVLAWSGRPDGLFAGFWQVVMLIGNGLQFIMSLFERRYYLAGVLLALLSILLIMAQ